MPERIRVGNHSDGLTIMKGLQPLLAEGWSLEISKGSQEEICAQLFKPKGLLHAKAQGNSFSVALRRLTVGLSKHFSYMYE